MKSHRTMKRIFIKPMYNIVDTEPELLICGSDDVASEIGINYGGIDEDGVKDPDARENTFGGNTGSNIWDEW